MASGVLITGADQHQGLAVIRGLGLAGVSVVAASHVPRNIGFASRFAHETALYANPHTDLDQFVADIIDIAARHQVSMILPAVESTLVAMNRFRDRIESQAPIAAVDSENLDWAVDKLKTVALAREVGVPVPRTVYAQDVATVLRETASFRFPVALKPRGNALHASTSNRLSFKVKYARTHAELAQILQSLDSGTLPLVQEYATGVGVCVAALFDHGRPVVMLPYRRLRELPLTGGVSVLRESLPRDERLEDYVIRLLAPRRWHGTAMVEFKYDAERDGYTLLEINGRFPASTALALDAGINLPYLAYCLHAGLPLPDRALLEYRIGVRERWLRGDLPALLAHLRGTTWRDAVPEARAALPSRARAIGDFLLGFRPGIHYDEFKWYDPLPGVVETWNWSASLLARMARPVQRLLRQLGPGTGSKLPDSSAP